MKHLIITTATISEDICLEKLGYSYYQRISDYQRSFDCVLKMRKKFDTITIIETVSKEKVDFLENSGIDVYYSKFDNSFSNKGINEMYHINDFLENYKIDDDDLIIKISGRYLMITDDILNIDFDFIAKYDGDIYPGDRGVHTFFFGFKKKLFVEFINSINKNDYDKCVEWLVKDYMLSKNIKILDNSFKLGVITCLYSKEMNRWTRVLS
jgi:hypothetical protein